MAISDDTLKYPVYGRLAVTTRIAPFITCSGGYALQDASHLEGASTQVLKDSGPKKPLRVWFLGPEASNIGYWDLLDQQAVIDHGPQGRLNLRIVTQELARMWRLS